MLPPSCLGLVGKVRPRRVARDVMAYSCRRSNKHVANLLVCSRALLATQVSVELACRALPLLYFFHAVMSSLVGMLRLEFLIVGGDTSLQVREALIRRGS